MAEGQVISAANEKHCAKGVGAGGADISSPLQSFVNLHRYQPSVMADNEAGNAQARRKVLRNGQGSDEHVSVGGGVLQQMIRNANICCSFTKIKPFPLSFPRTPVRRGEIYRCAGTVE